MLEIAFLLLLVVFSGVLFWRVLRFMRTPCCPACRTPGAMRDRDLPDGALPLWCGENTLTKYVVACCDTCGTILVTGIYAPPPKEVVDV